MAQANFNKKNNQFIKSAGVPVSKPGQYVHSGSSKAVVHHSKMPTNQATQAPTEADWERVALEVLDEHAGAWKRLADK